MHQQIEPAPGSEDGRAWPTPKPFDKTPQRCASSSPNSIRSKVHNYRCDRQVGDEALLIVSLIAPDAFKAGSRRLARTAGIERIPASRVAEGQPSSEGAVVSGIVPRFICIQVPNGSWQVWDNADDQPAALGNTVLVERSFESATSACSILNRIYDGDLQLKLTSGSPTSSR
ncbi:hypothetical protein ACHMW7_09055 [Aminobacter sp. UC22_36]|uniref:hypothetical protein n=1 Tax=Aminobacter sp. UC22_36 TaxID=3374549 RepID=UPI0037563AF0